MRDITTIKEVFHAPFVEMGHFYYVEFMIYNRPLAYAMELSAKAHTCSEFVLVLRVGCVFEETADIEGKKGGK